LLHEPATTCSVAGVEFVAPGLWRSERPTTRLDCSVKRASAYCFLVELDQFRVGDLDPIGKCGFWRTARPARAHVGSQAG
jgi:hypothetical protein